MAQLVAPMFRVVQGGVVEVVVTIDIYIVMVLGSKVKFKWASTRENLSWGVDQQRRRLAC